MQQDHTAQDQDQDQDVSLPNIVPEGHMTELERALRVKR